MSVKIEDAKEEARLALYKAITKAAETVNEDLTASAAAESLNHLAEAFAYTTSTAQPHS
ncbi:hypothetical protein [Streptomyces sp. STCH 565 A]|uniref:hypothetical protein n=1 Tax=Streptomyces sp. STCH 565 A TaxID=2950532 RepID=UPI002075C718|nr:hypothetical protein [Streptomyces sp. STCH 565 A]MCM8555377.1 hypothetical protein [Streptomyces sp. STCH 565 A]